MRVRTRAGMVLALVAVLSVAGAGGAAAKPSGRFSDKQASRTIDGWTVTWTKSGEKASAVPPLDPSPWTKEAFLSLDGELEITGSGTSPIGGQYSDVDKGLDFARR